jgi:small subunit ribosomal protein S18
VVKKKVSILSSENIDWVDYKDVNLLRRFMSERAKIRARRVTGNSAQQQRAVARAIRIAREMALLPYSVRQVTQRGRGGRRDRDRERPMEVAPEIEVAEGPAATTEPGADTEAEAAGGVDANVEAEAPAGDGEAQS